MSGTRQQMKCSTGVAQVISSEQTPGCLFQFDSYVTPVVKVESSSSAFSLH